MQGCTPPLLYACLSQEKKLGICKRMKTSELEAAIKKLCSYSEGWTINTIPENRLLLLHFSPNESSCAVITWQLCRLINNNPKKNKGFIVLAVFKNQVGRNVWNSLASTRDLVQKGVTASSLIPLSWIIEGSEKQQAPQEITLEIPHIKHWPWLPGLKPFSTFACFQVQEEWLRCLPSSTDSFGKLQVCFSMPRLRCWLPALCLEHMVLIWLSYGYEHHGSYCHHVGKHGKESQL